MDAPASAAANDSQLARAVTPVPLIDVKRQHAPLLDEMVESVRRVLVDGRFVLGPDCATLEAHVSRECGGVDAIACASGSDALLLALMALDIGPGDDVLVPSYTFFATVAAVARLGARPIYVDIDPSSFGIDSELLEAALTPATRAIIPVHLYGQCCDMDAITSFAARHGIAVIEDAAQAIGAEYRGVRAGAIGEMGCFSFYPTKNLGGCGDGGLITARDPRLAQRLRLLRVHGMEPRYYHQLLGINSRMDSIQAALLNVKIAHLETWTEARRERAARYDQLFRGCGLDQWLTLPRELPGRRHVWNQYIVRVPQGRRDALRAYLAQRQIGSEIYYPVPMHEQECFQRLAPATAPLPETERAARETLALPIFPELTAGEQAVVVRAIAAYCDEQVPRILAGPQPVSHAGLHRRAG